MSTAPLYLHPAFQTRWLQVIATMAVVKTEKAGSQAATKDLNDLSDAELVHLLADKGDMECLGVLYDRHGKRVLNRAWGMVREKSLAEDLTHDVFLKLVTKASKYREERNFIAWLNVLSYNVIIDELRKRKRMRVVELDDDNWQGPAYDDGAEELQEKVLFEIRVDRLKDLMGELNEDERTLLLMKYQDGVSVEEISGLLGIGLSAVKMRLLRTREKIIRLDGSMNDHASEESIR